MTESREDTEPTRTDRDSATTVRLVDSRLPTPDARRIVQEFLSSGNPETGCDPLADPRQLKDWLTRRALLESDAEVTGEEVERAIGLREGWRACLEDGSKPDPEVVARLNWIMSNAQVRARFGRRGRVWLEAAVDGFDGAITRLVLLNMTAKSASGSAHQRLPSSPAAKTRPVGRRQRRRRKKRK